MTTVCVVQPRFAPPQYFIQRCLDADIVILLGSAQFSRKSRDGHGKMGFTGQAHTQLLINGDPKWVGLPVEKGRKPINETALRFDRSTTRELMGRLEQGAGLLGLDVAELVTTSPTLGIANRRVLDLIWDRIGARPPMVVEDRDILPGDHGFARSEWMLALSVAVGATRYLAGGSAILNYLDRAAFDAAGIELVEQSWQEPEQNRPGWIRGLSILDSLAHNPALAL